MVLRFARPRARNGLLYRIQFTKTIAFCPRCCCRKQTEQSVHNRSFNLRCYKFVILGGRRAVFFSEAKLKFRHEALIAVTNLQVRFIVAHKSEGGVYILRVERENRFTFDRIVLLYLACVAGVWKGRKRGLGARGKLPRRLFYTERCEHRKYDFRNTLQRTFVNRY